jgi:hypothetical protein
MFSNTASFYVYIDILFRFGIECNITPFLLVLYLDSYKDHNCCMLIAERSVLNISRSVVFTQVHIRKGFFFCDKTSCKLLLSTFRSV